MKSEIMTQRFKQEMDKRGIGLYDASRAYNLPLLSLANCMYECKVPSTKKFVRVCSETGISMDYLLGFCDENKPVKKGVEYSAKNGYLDKISARVRQILKNERTMTAVAQKTKITYSCICSLASSGRAVKMEDFISLSERYNVSLDWLLGLEE